jgi:Right handed beta helix region
MGMTKSTKVATLLTALGLVLVATAPQSRASGTTPISSCGQIVTTNAVVTQDLVCSGTGIVVGASAITIDLKGFTLRGDFTTLHYGIDDNGYDQVTVKNGVVRNFDWGMYAYNNADKMSVSNLVASGNAHDGVYISGSSAKIQSLTATGNALHGIRVAGVSATVQSTTAVENGYSGIRLTGDFATVKSSTASANSVYGMVIEGVSAKIQSSTASGNFVHGIDVVGDSATVRSTTASGNVALGISVKGEAAVIKGNQAQANGYDPTGGYNLSGLGIDVSGYATTAPVGTNVALGNDDPAECEPASLC